MSKTARVLSDLNLVGHSRAEIVRPANSGVRSRRTTVREGQEHLQGFDLALIHDSRSSVYVLYDNANTIMFFSHLYHSHCCTL